MFVFNSVCFRFQQLTVKDRDLRIFFLFKNGSTVVINLLFSLELWPSTANEINMLLLLPGQDTWPFGKKTHLFELFHPPILNCSVSPYMSKQIRDILGDKGHGYLFPLHFPSVRKLSCQFYLWPPFHFGFIVSLFSFCCFDFSFAWNALEKLKPMKHICSLPLVSSSVCSHLQSTTFQEQLFLKHTIW